MWRGLGLSYLQHGGDLYQDIWRNHIDGLLNMTGVSAVRLAFSFDWDVAASADKLDFVKMDWVLSYLAQYGIKGILDNHGATLDAAKVTESWMQVANHYKGDQRVAGYEIFNEPGPSIYNTDPTGTIKGKLDVARFYEQCTKQIRTVDPDHICVWQGPWWYIPDFREIIDAGIQLQPNVVYGPHLWYGTWLDKTPEEASYLIMLPYVGLRKNWKVPFWMGEFGQPYDPTLKEYAITEQVVLRCEEQAIGWSLWQGASGPDIPLRRYDPYFPLKYFNQNLIRQQWSLEWADLTEFVIGAKGLDYLAADRAELWHNGDYIILKPGIIVDLQNRHVLPDKTIEIQTTRTRITQETKIINEEGTQAHPGDWNTFVYAISRIKLPVTFYLLLALGFTLPCIPLVLSLRNSEK